MWKLITFVKALTSVGKMWRILLILHGSASFVFAVLPSNPHSQESLTAEVFVWKPNESVEGKTRRAFKGVLVLCPGQNGSSEGLLKQKEWREFGAREGLAVVGFRFESSDADLKDGRGYFVASRGSGDALEEGLKKAGLVGLPLYLYGFSGGAHFAMSFAAWRPKRVKAICLYSFGWWTPPPEELKSEGLVVCGQADGTRYGSSLAYFQSGRSQGKQWTWLSLKELGHAPSLRLDDFVRQYVSSILRLDHDRGWKEVPNGQHIAVDNMTKKPVIGSWARYVGVSILPSPDLVKQWQELHHP